MKLKIATAELYTLAGSSNGKIGLGYSDPTVGLTIPEIQALLEHAQQELIKKGIVNPDRTISEPYKAALKPFHTFEKAVLIRIQEISDGADRLISLYFKDGNNLLLRSLDHPFYEISDEDHLDVVFDQVLRVMDRENAFALDFTLKESDVWVIKKSTNSSKIDTSAIAGLQNMEEEQLKEVTALLSQPLASVTIIPFSSRAESKQQGCVLMKSESSNWMLETFRGNNGSVRIRSLPKEEILKHLQRILTP